MKQTSPNPWYLVFIGGMTTIGAYLLDMPMILIVTSAVLTLLFLILAVFKKKR